MAENKGQSVRHLDKSNPKYDEYRENQSDAELTRDALEQMFKAEEILSKANEDELVGLKKDMDKVIDDDPYLSYVKGRYEDMEIAEMSLIVKAAEKAPLNGNEIAAFADLVINLNIMSPDPNTIFNLEYLKIVSASMTSKQRITLMANLPLEIQEQAVGVMKKFGMVTPDEVLSYANLAAEGESDAAGYAKDIIEEVYAEADEIQAMIDSIPANQKSYKNVHYDRPRSEMDRKYTVHNALKGVGLFISVMTLAINTGGAVRLASRGKFKEAMEHIKNHPYAGMSVVAIAGFKRALERGDRPLGEIVITGDGGHLRTLINKGVSRETIVSMKNKDAFTSLTEDMESAAKDPRGVENLKNKIKTNGFADTLPKLAANLESRGLMPETYQEEGMVNQLVDLYLELRSRDYWSYSAYYDFATYAEKKYYKAKRSETLRKVDEREEKAAKKGNKGKSPEEETK